MAGNSVDEIRRHVLLAYGKALNEGRELFPSDEQFGNWVAASVNTNLVVTPRPEERLAAMWAAANPSEFAEARAGCNRNLRKNGAGEKWETISHLNATALYELAAPDRLDFAPIDSSGLVEFLPDCKFHRSVLWIADTCQLWRLDRRSLLEGCMNTAKRGSGLLGAGKDRLRHYIGGDGYTAQDIEKALDRLARAIKANPADRRALLTVYIALEAELDTLKAADEAMRKVMARVSVSSQRI